MRLIVLECCQYFVIQNKHLTRFTNLNHSDKQNSCSEAYGQPFGYLVRLSCWYHQDDPNKKSKTFNCKQTLLSQFQNAHFDCSLHSKKTNSRRDGYSSCFFPDVWWFQFLSVEGFSFKLTFLVLVFTLLRTKRMFVLRPGFTVSPKWPSFTLDNARRNLESGSCPPRTWMTKARLENI